MVAPRTYPRLDDSASGFGRQVATEFWASTPSKAVLQCKELRLEFRERAAEFLNLLFGAGDL